MKASELKTIKIEPQLYDALKTLAKREDRPLASIFRIAIKKHLASKRVRVRGMR